MSNRKERRDAAEHRELILQTARSLFDEHGVEAVSMHQIAKTAGVGQGTLYRRYTHKSELCMDLMQDRSDRFMEETRVFLEENHSAAPLEQFEGVIARWAAFVEDQWKWLGIFAGPNCEERRMQVFESPIYLFLTDIIFRLLEAAAAVPSSEGREPLDLKWTTDAILFSFHPDLYSYHREMLGYSREQIERNVCRLFAAASGRP